jgi:ribosomal protein S18 acetylase RimI-like enzyme
MVYEMVENFLQVDSVAIDFAYRRAGLGAALITKAKNAAKRTRRMGVSCLVRESNLGAQLFFRAAGFRCIGIEDGAYPEYGSEAGYRFLWLVGG